MTDDAGAPVPAWTAATLRQLVAIQGRDLADALTQAAGLLAAALGTDKVDAFLYDPAREALVALGVSDTPLGRRERALGLDCLPLAAGGGFVAVYRTGVSYSPTGARTRTRGNSPASGTSWGCSQAWRPR